MLCYVHYCQLNAANISQPINFRSVIKSFHCIILQIYTLFLICRKRIYCYEIGVTFVKYFQQIDITLFLDKIGDLPKVV